MVEIVLAQLPMVDIVRCLCVCKRWNSIIHSPTFQITSNQLFNRLPWFLIFKYWKPSVIYDMEVLDWRRVQLPLPTGITEKPSAPIVASAGLLCYKSRHNSSYTVCNPLNGLARPLPKLWLNDDDYVRGIAMHTSGSNYKVFVAFGRWPHLNIKVFSSDPEKDWMELPVRAVIDGVTLSPVQRITDIDTSAAIKSNGVTTIGNEGQVLVHYLTGCGILLRFDTQKGTILMFPSLGIPPGPYHDVDLVECAGRIFMVVLIEEVDTETLCVWEFDDEKPEWKKIATMPPYISDNYFYSTVHLSCAGHGDYIMICLNVFSLSSTYYNDMMMYNIEKNTWDEVPRSFKDKPCSSSAWVCFFKPDIEAKV